MVARRLQADGGCPWGAVGDLLVGEVMGEQFEDLHFALGQFGQAIGGGGGFAGGEEVHHAPDRSQRSPRLPPPRARHEAPRP